MKVDVVVPSLGGGGAEGAALGLARALADRQHDVVLVTGELRGALVDRARDAVPVQDLRSARMVRSVPRLARHLRRRRPDAVVAVMSNAGFAAAAAVLVSRTPSRLAVWEQNHLTSKLRSHPPVRRLAIRGQVGWAHRRADVVVAVSEGVAEDLQQRTGHRGRVEVVHNPVVTDDLLAGGRQEPDHPWWARRGPGPVVVAVGRLHEQKDFPTLLHAMAGTPPEVQLVILGEGEERARLEALVERLGLGDRVFLPGFVGDVPAWVAHADLFVLSSRWEGLANALVEAVALGCPVVATDCPSGPREILQDGALGTLVPVGDVPALAGAIVGVLATGTRGDGTGIDRFRAERCAERFEVLLGG